MCRSEEEIKRVRFPSNFMSASVPVSLERASEQGRPHHIFHHAAHNEMRKARATVLLVHVDLCSSRTTALAWLRGAAPALSISCNPAECSLAISCGIVSLLVLWRTVESD